MRDLCHRRAAAEGEEPRGPCTRACAWRACTLAERWKNKLRAAEAGGSTESQPAPLAKMASGAGRVMSNALLLLLLTHPTTQTRLHYLCASRTRAIHTSLRGAVDQPPAHDGFGAGANHPVAGPDDGAMNDASY